MPSELMSMAGRQAGNLPIGGISKRRLHALLRSIDRFPASNVITMRVLKRLYSAFLATQPGQVHSSRHARGRSMTIDEEAKARALRRFRAKFGKNTPIPNATNAVKARRLFWASLLRNAKEEITRERAQQEIRVSTRKHRSPMMCLACARMARRSAHWSRRANWNISSK